MDCRLGWGNETLRLRGHCPSACRATPNRPGTLCWVSLS